MTIKKGDKVKIEYTGTLENGDVFDSSEKHGQPLEFEVGANQVIKGFDDAVLEMDVDQEKEFKISPAEGYGERNEQLIQQIPKSQFPEELKEGMMIGVGTPDGKQFPATVVKVEDENVTIDLNHPMSGKTMNFKIKVVSIN